MVIEARDLFLQSQFLKLQLFDHLDIRRRPVLFVVEDTINVGVF